MTSLFAGKVAFVSGAAAGIGRATALAFAQAGARVAVVDRDADGAAGTAQRISDAGGSAIAISCDVSDARQVGEAITRTVGELGGLDVAFNNAGVEQAQIPLTEVSEQVWDTILATNLTGLFLCMKEQLPIMQKAGGGVIINTSSGAGVVGIPNQAVYAASKHAVIGLSKSAALEYIDAGIRINVVAPGMIDTAMLRAVIGRQR